MHQENSGKRSDEYLQKVAMELFLGSAPERREELLGMRDKYDLCFSILEDGSEIVMEGGLYRHVQFNHRAMLAFWVSSFAAWEAYRAYAESLRRQEPIELGPLQDILTYIKAMKAAPDPSSLKLPDLVLEPGLFPDTQRNLQGRVASELAVLSTAWAMLHEVHHVHHQREGTSTSNALESEQKRQEEISCDAFACDFLLEKVSAYSQQSGDEIRLVQQKRQTGIHFALFALTVLSHEKWEQTETHPSVQARIDAIWKRIQGNGTNEAAAIIAFFAFTTLKKLWPNAPTISSSANGLIVGNQSD